jgi:hypothetical protein
VSPFVLSVLKYALLALLYFFIYRAVRSVVVDVAGRRSSPSAEPRRVSPAKATRGGRPPSSVVVHSSQGQKLGTFRLSGQVQIGRDASCDITVDDAYVSQQHARLYGEDGSWFVEDLGSTNGTYLNDRRLASPAPVHAGDVVRVGKTVLELRR